MSHTRVGQSGRKSGRIDQFRSSGLAGLTSFDHLVFPEALPKLHEAVLDEAA